jgi:hypothetical protein
VEVGPSKFLRNPRVFTALASGLADFNLRELLTWLLSQVGLAERQGLSRTHGPHDKPNGFYDRSLQLGARDEFRNGLTVWQMQGTSGLTDFGNDNEPTRSSPTIDGGAITRPNSNCDEKTSCWHSLWWAQWRT